MARSTDSKRTAAKSRMPAKRSPAGRGAGAGAAASATRPQPPEEQAAPAVDAGVVAEGSVVAPAREAVGEPAAAARPELQASMAGVAPAAMTGDDVEPSASPPPASAPPMDADPPPAPARAAAGPSAAAAPLPRRSLVGGGIDMHGQMVAFACRQTEFGLATSRAMLASRSLPEIMSLQSAFVGRSVESALAHTLELARLSAEILRAGLGSGRPR